MGCGLDRAVRHRPFEALASDQVRSRRHPGQQIGARRHSAPASIVAQYFVHRGRRPGQVAPGPFRRSICASSRARCNQVSCAAAETAPHAPSPPAAARLDDPARVPHARLRMGQAAPGPGTHCSCGSTRRRTHPAAHDGAVFDGQSLPRGRVSTSSSGTPRAVASTSPASPSSAPSRARQRPQPAPYTTVRDSPVACRRSGAECAIEQRQRCLHEPGTMTRMVEQ